MTLIGLRAVEKFYGGRAVLRGLDLPVAPGARIGLVGGNGAGKSTLLRLLAGLEEPDAGEVVRRRGLRVAFLPQYVERGAHTPMPSGASSSGPTTPRTSATPGRRGSSGARSKV